LSRGRRQEGRSWPLTFARNLVLWLPASALVWVFLTPSYNLFLTRSAEALVRLGERPSATRLEPYGRHHLVITRVTERVRGLPYSVRTTDLHFPMILLGALFLAVPGVPWRQRLENLALAGLAMAAFHLVLLYAWVQFVYATQLGAWSAQSYGPLARNVWGLGKHLLDLPFKLGLPLLLWAFFYLRELLPAPAAAPPAHEI
jgi:hypothetical protein